MSAQVIRRDGPSGRFYEVDGELYPSVTHILTAINKPALVPWAAKVEREACTEAAATLYEELDTTRQKFPRSWYLAELQARLGTVKAHQRTMEKAGDIGTQAHKAIEWIMRTAIGANAGPEPFITAPALVAVNAFRAWAAAVQLKPVLIERTVYSKTRRYAGTLDLLARVNGVLTMVDFKTGKAIYGESHLQAAAYSAALEEMGYLEPTASLVVRLRKDETDPTPFEPVDVPARAELLPVFLATRALWEWTYAQEQLFRARQRKPTAARSAVA
jgi:PD-(D/E)XK nuclease superfamily